MRTTVDLPTDLHAVATAIARDQSRSMSAVVVDLLRKGLASSRPDRTDDTLQVRAGFPLIDLPRTISTDDVYRADDE